MTSNGSPFFWYMPTKNIGIISTIIPIAAKVESPTFRSKKNDGTPMSAAREKQISCRLVRLNMTLLLTFVRSRGTAI